MNDLASLYRPVETVAGLAAMRVVAAGMFWTLDKPLQKFLPAGSGIVVGSLVGGLVDYLQRA